MIWINEMLFQCLRFCIFQYVALKFSQIHWLIQYSNKFSIMFYTKLFIRTFKGKSPFKKKQYVVDYSLKNFLPIITKLKKFFFFITINLTFHISSLRVITNTKRCRSRKPCFLIFLGVLLIIKSISYQHDDIVIGVVWASASQSVDLGFISHAKSYQKI